MMSLFIIKFTGPFPLPFIIILFKVMGRKEENLTKADDSPRPPPLPTLASPLSTPSPQPPLQGFGLYCPRISILLRK